jgi:hypothetical protein
VLLVPVQIDALGFEFLVDTGAAYTAISPRVAVLFDLLASSQRRMTIAPVQGTVLSVPHVSLPDVCLGGRSSHKALPPSARSNGSYSFPVSRFPFVLFPQQSGTITVPSFQARFAVAPAFGKPSIEQRLMTDKLRVWM